MINWRLSMILETSNQSVWSNVFWYVKVSIFWKCIQCIIHWDKSQILKQFPSEKINGTKNAPFFLSRAPTHHSWFLYGLGSTRFVSLKLCVGYSIFDSVPFLLKFIHLLNNMHERFDFKMSKLFLKLKL